MFSIGNSDYSHPYKNKFIINQLPTFMILKNDDVIYSINDTILKYNNKSLEETLLNGLMQ